MFANRQTKIFLMMVLLLAILTGGLQKPVFAAETAKGYVSVIGDDKTGAILPDTEVNFTENQTALDVLKNTTGINKVELSKDGRSLITINNLSTTPDGTFYWAFYINGIGAQVNYDEYKVNNGDKLTFVYTDWTKPSNQKVTVKILDKSGKDIVPTVNQYLNPTSIIGQPTALQLLQTGLGKDKVGIEVDPKYGPFITSINGIIPAKGDYWGFYVNGKMADVGAGT